jgi:radical SAM protein with 4Fe4S-binding SPASM domain
MKTEDRIDKRGCESAKIDDIHLLIELSDHCNCKCIMCKQSMAENMHGNNPKQHMDLALFVKIIEDIKKGESKITSIDPLWTGESMIHPDFKEMMYYLFTMNRKYGLFRGFVLNTNAIAMNREISDIFLDYAKYVQEHRDSCFMRLYFSLEAIRPYTYQNIKNTNEENLNRAIDNIKYFIFKRKKLNLTVPNLTFGFIVMEENQDEAEEFRDFWKEALRDSGVPHEVVSSWPLLTDRDSIYYRQLISSEPKKAEDLHRKVAVRLGLVQKDVLPTNKKQKKNLVRRFRPPCGALWRTPNIASNGDVVPCCRDMELTLSLGNIKENSLHDIWHGDKITELRLSHIKGEFDVLFQKWPVCKTCVEPEAGVLSDDEILSYLQSINKEEIMKKYIARKFSGDYQKDENKV